MKLLSGAATGGPIRFGRNGHAIVSELGARLGPFMDPVGMPQCAADIMTNRLI